MPSSTKKLATLRPDLATFEQIDMEMNRRGLVAAQLMPPFEVQEQSGNFGVLPIKAMLAAANADTKRTSTGGYGRGEWNFDDRDYKTKENGWEEPVDDREQNMYHNYFQLEEIAAHRAWDVVLMGLESRCINTILTQGAGQKQNAAALWSDPVAAVPIDDVKSALEAVWLRTGVWPDTLALARRDYRNLRRSVQIKKEIMAEGAGKSAQQAVVTKEMIAECLDVKKIVVSDAIKNTANPAKDVVIASAWPEGKVAVMKTPDTPTDFKSVCFGRIFHWGGDGSRVQGENLVGVVEMYREEGTRKDICRVRHETAEFKLYNELVQIIEAVR